MTRRIPDDGWTENDGYVYAICCVPKSQLWKAHVRDTLYDLGRGRAWDETTGNIKATQLIAREIERSLCFMDCDELLTQITRIADALEGETAAQTKAIRQLTAALIGDSPDLTQPIPDDPDYTAETGPIPGLIPFLRSMLVTGGLLGLYPDMTIADSINAGLIGNQGFALPLPFQGDGVADILDDQADLLNQLMTLIEDHLVMSDSSLFNPIAGEKNLVETIETALRTTSYSDLEPFPNVADVLQQSLKLEDDAFWSNLWRKLGLKPPLPGLNTITQNIAGILAAMSSDVDGKDKIAKAIKDLEMQVNVNNINGCCDDVDVNCDESQIQTITTDDLDCGEDKIININGSGNGQV